jgi:hypothetical protein
MVSEQSDNYGLIAAGLAIFVLQAHFFDAQTIFSRVDRSEGAPSHENVISYTLRAHVILHDSKHRSIEAYIHDDLSRPAPLSDPADPILPP